MNSRACYDLATSKVQHVNSNGAFTQAADGSIHFVYCRSFVPGDGTLYRIHSSDGGLTWSRPDALPFSQNAGDRLVFSAPSLLTLKSGRILIAYQKFVPTDPARSDVRPPNCMQIATRFSDDGGLSWSSESVCVPPNGYYLVCNDRLCRTTGGRIFIAVCCHTLPSASIQCRSPFSINAEDSMNPYGMAQIYFSDDDGVSWRASNSVLAISVPCSSTGVQEPGIVEVSPGFLMCFMRTDLGRQYEAYSGDNGLSWSPPEPSRFTSSCSPAVIKRRESDGLLAAVWNPIPNYVSLNADSLSARQRLVLSVSRESGARWSKPFVLEDDPSCEFSHPALFFADDHLLISYNVSPLQHSRRFKIRLQRLPLESLRF